MCDLHLPFEKRALQYRVLDWAIDDIRKKQPGCIICAGDVTCDGNLEVYNTFLEKIKAIGIPFLYIPGNSDLTAFWKKLPKLQLFLCIIQSKN